MEGSISFQLSPRSRETRACPVKSQKIFSGCKAICSKRGEERKKMIRIVTPNGVVEAVKEGEEQVKLFAHKVATGRDELVAEGRALLVTKQGITLFGEEAQSIVWQSPLA